MKQLPQSNRIVDTHRNRTDEEERAWQEAENDPDWQLHLMEQQTKCAKQNWEVHQQCLQEAEDAKPWWQKIF